MDAKSRKRLRSNRLPQNVNELLQTPASEDGNVPQTGNNHSTNEDSDSVNHSSGKRGSKRGKHLNQHLNQSPNNPPVIPTNNHTTNGTTEQPVTQTVTQSSNRARRSELDKLTEEFFTSPENTNELPLNIVTNFTSQQPNSPEIKDPLDLEYQDEKDDANDEPINQIIPQFMIRPAPADLPHDIAIANPFSSYYHRSLKQPATRPHDNSANPVYNPSSLIQYDANQIPIHPQFSGPTRGYIAYFFWEHYRYEPINRTADYPMKPPFTYLAASVPTIYQSILDILSDVDRAHRGIEVLPLINQQHPSTSNFNRIVKVVHPSPFNQAINLSLNSSKNPLPQTYETYLATNPTTKTRLVDRFGIEYQINAARKDQLGLIAKVVERLNLCPLLIDVYAVQGAEKKLVVGAGPAVRAQYKAFNHMNESSVNNLSNGQHVDSVGSSDDKQATSPTDSQIAEAAQLISPTHSHSDIPYRCTCTPQMRRVKTRDDFINNSLSHSTTQSKSSPADHDSPGSRTDAANQQAQRESDMLSSPMDDRSDDDQTARASHINHVQPTNPSDQSSMDTQSDEIVNQPDQQSNDVLASASPVPSSTKQEDVPAADSIIETKEPSATTDSPVADMLSQSIALTEQALHPSISPLTILSNNQSNNQFNEKERLKLVNKIATLQKQLNESNLQLNNQITLTMHWENEYKLEKDKNCKLWGRVVDVQRQVRHMSRPLTTALAGQGRL